MNVVRFIPSPRRGEGWGEGARRRALIGTVKPEHQFVADDRENPFGVLKHLIVPKADHPMAKALNCARSVGIGGVRMLSAVGSSAPWARFFGGTRVIKS